jgi:hypothetical protein
MNDNPQPRKEGEPLRIAEAETEFSNCQYIFVDAVGDSTRRPNRDPRARQLRPDQPTPPPSTDQDKNT